MIITCEGCETKYLLSDEKVPDKGIRVRCPKCRFVWRLSPPAHGVDSDFEVSGSDFTDSGSVVEQPQGGWASGGQPSTVVTEHPETPMEEERVELGEERPEAKPEEPTDSPELRKKKGRARRQARVFASDILVYNREKRDKGLANGDLMTALGPEIKKAWEAYKEKVGPEIPEASNYFREALNEILADGEEVF
jgi:predicted Zn finger-like uncharacterized protein